MFASGLFTETFMIHAWLSGTIVAVVCAFLGFFVVLRGSIFAAHALPQTGFAGGAAAVLLHLNPLYGLTSFTLASALLMGHLSEKERHEVATALILVAALGTGALFLGLSDKYATGAYALLFGQLVGISFAQVLATAVLGLVCLSALAFLYRPLLLASVSREIAQSRGIPIRRLEMCFMGLVGLATAISVTVVGALLCFSLLIGPAAAAMNLAKSPRRAMALSLLFAATTVWLSLVLGYYSGWPIGFYVSLIGALLYLTTRSRALL